MRLGLIWIVGFALLELWLLMQLSGAIGALATILLVIVSAMAGIWLLRIEGLRTWLRAGQRLQAGQLPAEEVVEGGLLAIGALLLVLPGPISDIVGLVCVLPPTRRRLARSAVPRRMMRPFRHSGGPGFGARGFGSPGRERGSDPFDADFERLDRGPGDPRPSGSSHTTIEGEFRREDD